MNFSKINNNLRLHSLAHNVSHKVSWGSFKFNHFLKVSNLIHTLEIYCYNYVKMNEIILFGALP